MKKLIEALKSTEPILNVYLTAGFPTKNDTVLLCNKLEECGVKIIELGVPASDPIGDGPTIQEASTKAIANGVTLSWVLETVTKIRENNRCAIILMGYLNQFIQYGVEKFCKEAASCGVDGVIIPDLPLEEYKAEFKPYFESNNLTVVFLVTPETTNERIIEIDNETRGFIYAVSSSSTTGGDAKINEQYLLRLKQLNLKNRFLVGFGINNRADFVSVSEYAAGAIIGSAYIRAIKDAADPVKATEQFIKGVL